MAHVGCFATRNGAVKRLHICNRSGELAIFTLISTIYQEIVRNKPVFGGNGSGPSFRGNLLVLLARLSFDQTLRVRNDWTHKVTVSSGSNLLISCSTATSRVKLSEIRERKREKDPLQERWCTTNEQCKYVFRVCSMS